MRPLEKMPEARPLRLLYIIDSLVPGGAEQSLSVLAPHYRDLGVELTVGFLADRPGLHLELERAGAQLVNLAGAGGRVGNVARVARVLADCKPDLVHTTLFEADIAGRVASALRGAPVVSTLPSAMYDWEHVHDPSLKPWRVRVAQVADMSTASWVRRFHAVSGHVATLMAGRLRIPQSRIDVIPRGRDPRAFGNRSSDRRAEARRRLGIDDDELMVFAAARQEHKKGLDVLLRSFPHVAESLPSARLVLAGRPGLQTPLLKRLSSELDLSSVMNLGPRRDVPDLLCAADVFVMPSVSEGFPGTLLEAMALEAPIVATDLPGIREVLGSNVIATLVPPRDPDALGRAIVRTLEDPVASGERAALARQRFLENFTVHRVAERMVGFYRRALQEA